MEYGHAGTGFLGHVFNAFFFSFQVLDSDLVEKLLSVGGPTPKQFEQNYRRLATIALQDALVKAKLPQEFNSFIKSHPNIATHATAIRLIQGTNETWLDFLKQKATVIPNKKELPDLYYILPLAGWDPEQYVSANRRFHYFDNIRTVAGLRRYIDQYPQDLPYLLSITIDDPEAPYRRTFQAPCFTLPPFRLGTVIRSWC